MRIQQQEKVKEKLRRADCFRITKSKKKNGGKLLKGCQKSPDNFSPFYVNPLRLSHSLHVHFAHITQMTIGNI